MTPPLLPPPPPPPRLARALIRAAAPADLAGALVDDLDETFARESRRRGSRAARRWYWREAVGGLQALVRIRLDRRQSRVPAPSGGRFSATVALRHATRRLFAARGFSATAVITLALAFAANLTIAALVYGVLLRPLPYRDADRLVEVGHRTPGLGAPRAGQSAGGWSFYRRESRSFAAIGIYNENVVNLTDAALEAERVPIAMISFDVFDALGVPPMFGAFTRDDDGPDTPPTVMLSHQLWQRRYGSDPSIVGKTVGINGNARRVIAVMPRGFAFPTPATGLWMRQGFGRQKEFGDLVYGSVARLRDSVTPDAAEAELNALIRRLPNEYGDVRAAWLSESQLSARVEPLKLTVTRDASGALWLTLAAGAVVLLLGGANVTNLFLIRSEQRIREVGIARALGATSRHLFASLLAETLLIAAAAAALAVPIATVALNLVVMRARGLLPRLDAVAIDGVTLAGLAAVTVLTALVLAAAGLWRARGVTLRDAGRGASASPAQARVRLALSSVQVALAFALVVTSTLLVRSVWNLVRLDKGFSAERALTFEIALPFRGYDTFGKSAGYHATLLERLRALPGVEAAGAVGDLPLSGFTLKRYHDSLVIVERGGQAPLEVNGVNWKLATPGYFDAMRIPVLRGRWVQPGDHFDDTYPIVVSDGFARRHLGVDSPIGQRIRHDDDPHWWTVVGVVGDVLDDGLRTSPADAVYAPVLDQEKGAPFSPSSMTHVVRTTVPPESIASAVRRVVADVDARVPLAEMRTLAAVVSQSMARDALVLALVAVAAGLAVVMGVVGLYGALAYSIAQRRRELGVRLALGATAGRLRRDVSRAPGVAIVVGLAAGAMLTWLTGRLLAGLLFGVDAGDAATYAASAAMLTATCAGSVALSLGGLRRVSALEALRSE